MKNPCKNPNQNPQPIQTPSMEKQQSDPTLPSDPTHQPPFSLLPSIPDIVVFRDSDSSDSDTAAAPPNPPTTKPSDSPSDSPRPNLHPPAYINPEPHVSSQFYTFNRESHALMVRCILERRLASPDEIRRATPRAVLRSWRLVWKDRNEDTAYLTAWKRIQDKLNAHVDNHGNEILYFKNNSQQYVSHVDQWQDIVMSFHGDADLRHLGLKDTVERIKQVWTVGAKFYGIPESFIRACVASCPVCSDASASSAAAAQRTKRRRFEYTESFDVPARDVPQKLQQLAAKHKVVLCIRQKYIRYKPFMAEVKDYACHRAGEPAAVAAAKKPRALKREPYASKRCGCGFRIRAIVPIANYNEKDKTFVYQEEGTAVFKLYAVHSGHEPGPLDGNARIIHRVVGHKPGFDQDTIYGIEGDVESEGFGLMGKDEGDLQLTVLQQVQELQAEIGVLEGKITKMPRELFNSVSRELSDIMNRVRNLGEDASRSSGLLLDKQHSDEVLVDSGLGHWGDPHHDRIYGDGKDQELIDDEDDAFERSLGDIPPWDRCRDRKDLMRENCKSDKWLKDFDEKSILNCEEAKLIKPIRDDGTIVTDASLVGIQVDSFYPENPKWYDSPCGLDPGTDCGDGAFRHGEIV
ncbi:uncharacterized protein LOC131248411 [Magnolia sinica]|uniref:uncharacterized protein LOC131248411 n=1 Tax=Magnolia sinica TaxID=86752 RepID=UPI00265A0B12|nr:uncharacterized protein LOC131248411 [Magnolia sinica]